MNDIFARILIQHEKRKNVTVNAIFYGILGGLWDYVLNYKL